MSIQFTSPERQNLSLLSIVIILYYLEEGSFSNGIKFFWIGLEFNKPEVLEYFVWILFIWLSVKDNEHGSITRKMFEKKNEPLLRIK